MEVIERKAAKIAGLIHYFTGRPCKHGHIARRQTSDGACLVCKSIRAANLSDYYRQYRLINSDSANKRAKVWADNNRERMLANVTRWSSANPEKVRAAARRWRNNNPELAAERIAKWDKENPLKKVEYKHRRRARVRGATLGGPISTADLTALRLAQNDLCPYCNKGIGKGHVDHKDPIARGGPHVLSNLQWTCQRCNQSKSHKTDEEFRRYLVECQNAKERPSRYSNRQASASKNTQR